MVRRRQRRRLRRRLHLRFGHLGPVRIGPRFRIHLDCRRSEIESVRLGVATGSASYGPGASDRGGNRRTRRELGALLARRQAPHSGNYEDNRQSARCTHIATLHRECSTSGRDPVSCSPWLPHTGPVVLRIPPCGRSRFSESRCIGPDSLAEFLQPLQSLQTAAIVFCGYFPDFAN